MSKIVKNNGVVYLCGQVGDANKDIKGQTQDCINKIEALLAEAGSGTDKILQAIVWLADMDDFAAMNEVWDEWLPVEHAPARACGEAKLARKELLVEIIITAAYDSDYNY
ncbi:UNVERIFIED_CONTAM: hypothetical protein GTU68_036141 [Idotea baltica]|nr:hypothetical protein [Idotea baltica]